MISSIINCSCRTIF